MALSNKVQDATLNYLMPKLVDTILVGNTGLSLFLAKSKAGVWKGAQTQVPVKIATNPNGGSFVGFDLLPTAGVDNTVLLTYDAKFNEQAVVLSKTDLSVNDTEMQVADLLKRQIASDAYDLADKLGTQFYGDGTGNGGKDLLGLGAIVDDGTTVPTIGGQSRSTYPSLDATVTATGGTLTLAKMYAGWDAAQQDTQQPTVVLTTKAVRSLYSQLLDPTTRFMLNTDKRTDAYLNAGQQDLAFRNALVLSDSKCPTGKMFMLNESSMEFQALPRYFEGQAVPFVAKEMDGEPTPDVVQGLGFYWTGFVRPVNQETIIGRVVHAGNMVAMNPRYNTQLTGITGI